MARKCTEWQFRVNKIIQVEFELKLYRTSSLKWKSNLQLYINRSIEKFEQDTKHWNQVEFSSKRQYETTGQLLRLCLKEHPNINDCNLKTDYHILIIFDTNIPDTTGHQKTVQGHTSPASATALPGKTEQTKYSLFRGTETFTAWRTTSGIHPCLRGINAETLTKLCPEIRK